MYYFFLLVYADKKWLPDGSRKVLSPSFILPLSKAIFLTLCALAFAVVVLLALVSDVSSNRTKNFARNFACHLCLIDGDMKITEFLVFAHSITSPE